MRKKMTVKSITLCAMIAAVYVVVSLTLGSIAFGALQLRIASALYVLCTDKKFIYGCVLGTVITNVFSPLGIIDVVFGSIATLAACLTFYKIKNPWTAAVVAASAVGVLVGVELYIVFGGSLFFNIASVVASQLIVYVIGICLDTLIAKKILRCLK